MKFLKWLLIIVLVLVLAAALVGGYFGLVPGFSNLFGSNKPKDLGVKVSMEAFNSGNNKMMLQRVQSAGNSSGLVYHGSHAVNASLTSEEISSLIQKGFYKYNPIAEGFEMKIHDDGSVEASGILNFSKLEHYFTDANLGNVQDYIKKLGILTPRVPFYLSGTASVINNQASLNLSAIQLGRISIPTSQAIADGADSLIDRRLQNIPGMSISSLSFSQGQMHYVGNFPDKLEVAK